MQTNEKLPARSIFASIAMIIGCIFLFSSMLPQKKFASVIKAAATFSAEGKKIYRVINAKEIKDALVNSKNKKIILNIYPVKLSKDITKQDFDLVIYFQEPSPAKKSIGNPINLKSFKTQASWYIYYLKSKNIAKENIPYGYYLEITPALLENLVGLKIGVLAEQFQLSYCALKEDPNNKTAPVKKPLNNHQNTLPDCCSQPQIFDLLPDSSGGKCPPCLNLTSKLLLEGEMQAIIDDVYK